MNDDHGDNTVSIVKKYVGVDCTDAKIISMDALGMTVKATISVAGGGNTKIRFDSPRTYL
jgi:Protein of unknown function (DUF2470)